MPSTPQAARPAAVACTCGQRAPAIVAAFVGLCALLPDSAWASSFRCEVDGRTLYTDRPCAAGRVTEIADGPNPSATDRASAAARADRDRAALAAFDEGRRRDERRSVVADARREADRRRVAQQCDKLSRLARHAREDAETAGPRDQPKARVRATRAEEDRAERCPRR